ncbi:MAG TPA: hypothetical protein VMU21_02660 [Thermodesulfovibrionales bacterium]|nr:hypothetical protein [Thermodesulfovibrionales bacterium]
MVIIVLQCYPSLVWGDEFRLVPAASIEQQYNSNILLSTDPLIVTPSGKGDFVTIVSLGADMVERTERLDTDLLVRFDKLIYANHGDLNDTNQTYSGRARYQVTPQLGISCEAAYTKNYNPTLNIIPLPGLPPGLYPIQPFPPLPGEPGGPGGPGGPGTGPGTPSPTAGAFLEAVPWRHITALLAANYQVDETTSATISYSYGNDYYYNNPNYQNDSSQNVTAVVTHDFSQYLPYLKGWLNLNYNYYWLPDSRNNGISGTVGFSWDFNELWSISSSIGATLQRSELFVTQFIPIPPGLILVARETLNNSGWSGVGGVSLNYKGEYMNGSLTYNKGITLASGLNGAAVSDSIVLQAGYSLTREWSTALTAAYQTYRSDTSNLNLSTNNVNYQTFFISTGVRYMLPEFLRAGTGRTSLEAFYGYNVNHDSVSHTKADRNLFTVRLHVEYPFFE